VDALADELDAVVDLDAAGQAPAVDLDHL